MISEGFALNNDNSLQVPKFDLRNVIILENNTPFQSQQKQVIHMLDSMREKNH